MNLTATQRELVTKLGEGATDDVDYRSVEVLVENGFVAECKRGFKLTSRGRRKLLKLRGRRGRRCDLCDFSITPGSDV